MSELDDIELAAFPAIARQFRKRIRTGFALCGAATGLALLYMIGLVLTSLVKASSTDPSQVSESNPGLRLTELWVDGASLLLIFAGLVLLYRVPFGQRWRLTSTILLGAVGADLAFLSMRVVGGTGAAVAVANELGFALAWIELWMIAVLAADAAEAVERPDLTHQTEVVGRWIIGGASAWLISVVWSFDPGQIADSSAVPQDALTVLLGQAAVVLHVFAVIRITGCCMGLVGAYVPIQDAQQPPT